jgi:hypothetical protein
MENLIATRLLIAQTMLGFKREMGGVGWNGWGVGQAYSFRGFRKKFLQPFDLPGLFLKDTYLSPSLHLLIYMAPPRVGNCL